MKLLAATAMSLSLLASASAQDSQPIRITRSGTQPPRQGDVVWIPPGQKH